MSVELTVVGIRHYLPSGEADYDELFKRMSEAPEVYLSIDQEGSEFPGAIHVRDAKDNMIGYISNTECRLIDLRIKHEGTIPATVSECNRHDKCIYVKAGNDVGFSEPSIKQAQPEPAETVFAIMLQDSELKRLSDLLKAKACQMLDGTKDNVHLKKTAKAYIALCDKSIDGETSFARVEIKQLLKNVREHYPQYQDELDEIIHCIHEKDKDMSRNEQKTKVYQAQYKRIKDYASVPIPGKQYSQLEEYIQKLKYIHGARWEEYIQKEIDYLSELLSNELNGKYTSVVQNEKEFAKILYFQNYSMHALYILFTRMILREYLIEKFGDSPTRGSDPVVSESLEKDDPVVDALMPIFFNNRHEALAFLHRIKGVKPIVVTVRVNELLSQGKIDKESCHKPLHTILHDNGYYKPSLSNWNSQIG